MSGSGSRSSTSSTHLPATDASAGCGCGAAADGDARTLLRKALLQAARPGYGTASRRAAGTRPRPDAAAAAAFPDTVALLDLVDAVRSGDAEARRGPVAVLRQAGEGAWLDRLEPLRRKLTR